jgi:hypothetical protein
MARRGNAPFAAQTNRPGSGVGEAFDNFADGEAELYFFDAKGARSQRRRERNNRILGIKRDGVLGRLPRLDGKIASRAGLIVLMRLISVLRRRTC